MIMSNLRNIAHALTGSIRVSALLVLLLVAPFYTRAQSIEARDTCALATCDTCAVTRDTCDFRFGLSTNLPYDITYIPNYGLTTIPSLSLEFYPAAGHWTFGLDGEFAMWRHADAHRYLQVYQLTASTRRYFHAPAPEERFHGWYLLGSVNAARYGLGFRADKGYEGEGLGLSIGGGRKCVFGRRMFIDFGLALGVFYSGYDPYVWGNDATGWYYYDYAGDPDAFRKRNQRLLWWGPTRIYLNIGFDFSNRHRAGRTGKE